MRTVLFWAVIQDNRPGEVSAHTFFFFMLHKATVLCETISSDICGEVNELQTLRM